MTSYDPRLTPARPDVAADFLKGKVTAERYEKGRSRQVRVSRTAIKSAPSADAGMASELLFGEGFTVYDEADGWAWGQAARDGYVGYVLKDALGTVSPATHWVAAPMSHRYPAPDLKRPPLHPLYGGSLLTIADAPAVKGFLPLKDGGYVYGRQVRTLTEWAADITATAESFLHAPYLWGGRTAAGIDCSGLVQMAVLAAGHACPRDSDMQMAALGAPLPDGSDLRRGDIVCFPGHIGFMVDGDRLLHANATHMAVTINPLEEVIAIVRDEKPDAWVKVKRLPE